MIVDRQYSVSSLVPYIDWGYFLHAWQMPTSLRGAWSVHDCTACREAWIGSLDEKYRVLGRETLRLANDSRTMLEEISKKTTAKCRVGVFDANSLGDDIIILADDGHEHRLPCLRQQSITKGETSLCLSDYIRPLSSGKKDKIGIFATTIGYDPIAESEDDPYRRLLGQTLCDRLAEAAACHFHEEVRKEIWGYAPNEHLSIEDMLREHNQGIRPAVGYPSLPDQSINFIIDTMIDMQGMGITLTENGAMLPHASVSGLMIALKDAHYFAVGPIDEDQFSDYAKRRNLPKEKMRQYLAANLKDKTQAITAAQSCAHTTINS